MHGIWVLMALLLITAACGGSTSDTVRASDTTRASDTVPASEATLASEATPADTLVDPAPIVSDPILTGDFPRMVLTGDPTIDLEGGYCYVDDEGLLVLAIGYIEDWDARLQPEPLPHFYSVKTIRAQPGTWDTGSIFLFPTGEEIRMDDGSLVMTLGGDLLAGSFTWNNGSGSYSCPRMWTLEELDAGYESSTDSP